MKSFTTLLSTRALIRIWADNSNVPTSFLQGIITNDTHLLSSQPSLYAHLLNSKGRVQADLLLFNYQDSILIEADSSLLSGLTKLLKTHNLDKSVKIEAVTDLYPGFSTSPSNSPNDVSFEDPRIPSFGYRTISTEASTEHHPEKYLWRRIEHTLPEGKEEIPSGKALPLCYNLDWLNGVSFTKGCYLGQELTQRTHFTGAVSKRVFSIKGAIPANLIGGRRATVEPLSGAVGEGYVKMAMVRVDKLDMLSSSLIKQPWQFPETDETE